jgi:hypothetical protein
VGRLLTWSPGTKVVGLTPGKYNPALAKETKEKRESIVISDEETIVFCVFTVFG